jgi:thiol-disulfide isomerase/thioredoxin
MNYNEKYLKYKIKYLKLQSIMDKNKDSINMSGGSYNSSEDKKIYLFKANWCPHCRVFKSTWNNLKNEFKDRIKFITYDSEKHSEEIKSFKIEGYPTIILTVGNKAIEYVGPRNDSSIRDFINQYN